MITYERKAFKLKTNSQINDDDNNNNINSNI